MVKIAVLVANGTEEIEFITPVDILRRTGAEVHSVSVSGEFPLCSHGVAMKADKLIENVNLEEYDGIVIPGGMPGATNIAKNPKVIKALKKALAEGKIVASICASPAVVLASNGLIDGKKATCYPAEAFIRSMECAEYTGADVEVDGKLITANGPRSAMKFSLAICDVLGLEPKF